jgi:hypothetical protein
LRTSNGGRLNVREGEVNVKSLGRQTIDGEESDGRRVTGAFQSGKIDNERPIVAVSER